jgi:cobalt transporter subunit CbtB
MVARLIAGTEVKGVAAALPGVLAMIVGAFLVLGAGFSPISVIHNATHDSRHVMFPCH